MLSQKDLHMFAVLEALRFPCIPIQLPMPISLLQVV